MKLSTIGFFRELDHGDPNGPRLVEQVRERPQRDEPGVVAYLRNGLLLIGCPGVVCDVLDGASGPIGAPHIMTDGVWAWPGDLPYYVEKYHLTLPDDFIEHVRKRHSRPPVVGEIDLNDLEF